MEALLRKKIRGNLVSSTPHLGVWRDVYVETENRPGSGGRPALAGERRGGRDAAGRGVGGVDAGGLSGDHRAHPGRGGRPGPGQAGGHLCDPGAGRPGPPGGGRLRPGGAGPGGGAGGAAGPGAGRARPGGGPRQPGHHPRQHRPQGCRPDHGDPPPGGTGRRSTSALSGRWPPWPPGCWAPPAWRAAR